MTFNYTAPPKYIASKDNAQFKALKKLARDNSAYKKTGQLWLEGDHLCRAYLQHGLQPIQAVFSASFWQIVQQSPAYSALSSVANAVQMADELFDEVSALDAAGNMGFLIEVPQPGELQAGVKTIVLDRVQDAGNVGSILRSAAAFGFGQVMALQGTASLWSPKVVRAAMGAHFGLRMVEGVPVDEATHHIGALQLPLLATSSHQGAFLHQAKLPADCTWVFGHEGTGVSAELLACAEQTVRIVQPGGEESLNVAAAAAICLHQSAASAA